MNAVWVKKVHTQSSLLPSLSSLVRKGPAITSCSRRSSSGNCSGSGGSHVHVGFVSDENSTRKYHNRRDVDSEGWCAVNEGDDSGAKGIMVVSTREHAGKTSMSMALVSGLIRRFGKDRVGYFKPFGQELVEVETRELEEEEEDDYNAIYYNSISNGNNGNTSGHNDSETAGKADRQWHHFAPYGAGSARERTRDGKVEEGLVADEEKDSRRRRKLERKVIVDRDALLAKAHFHLKAPLKTMSPLVIDKYYTRDFLEGKIDLRKQWRKVGNAYDRMRKEHDYLVVEGTAHTAAGSIIGMSSADVAARLGLEVILVATGGVGSTFDELALNRQTLVNKGVRLRGVVINKVRDDKLDTVSSYAHKALKRWGVPLLACIPYGAGFDSPSLRDLELLYDSKLVSGQEYALNRFLHYELVTTSLGRFMHKLNAPAREAEANVWRETAKDKARAAGVETRGESCSLVEPEVDLLTTVKKFTHATQEPLPLSLMSPSSSKPTASSSSSTITAPAAAESLLASAAASSSSSSSSSWSTTPPPPSSSSSAAVVGQKKLKTAASSTPKGVMLESAKDPGASKSWRNTCFVTHSSRADIILGLLSHMHDQLKKKERSEEYTGSAMLLTGDVKLPQYVLDYIRHSGFPVLMTGISTSDSMRRLQQFSAKMHKDDVVRTNQVLELCEPCIDFDGLQKSWRLNDSLKKSTPQIIAAAAGGGGGAAKQASG